MKPVDVLAFAVLYAGALIGTNAMRDTKAGALQTPICAESARRMARLELVFGMSRPSGVPIRDEEWASFIKTEVTPRFPSGFTVVRGEGQWRGGDGRIAKETSNIILIWHDPEAHPDVSIEAIRTAYKARFDQESVIRVDSTSCVSF